MYAIKIILEDGKEFILNKNGGWESKFDKFTLFDSFDDCLEIIKDRDKYDLREEVKEIYVFKINMEDIEEVLDNEL